MRQGEDQEQRRRRMRPSRIALHAASDKFRQEGVETLRLKQFQRPTLQRPGRGGPENEEVLAYRVSGRVKYTVRAHDVADQEDRIAPEQQNARCPTGAKGDPLARCSGAGARVAGMRERNHLRRVSQSARGRSLLVSHQMVKQPKIMAESRVLTFGGDHMGRCRSDLANARGDSCSRSWLGFRMSRGGRARGRLRLPPGCRVPKSRAGMADGLGPRAGGLGAVLRLRGRSSFRVRSRW